MAATALGRDDSGAPAGAASAGVLRLRPAATRRRPMVAAASGVLVVVSAAVVAASFASAGHTTAAVVVVRPVPADGTVRARDLGSAQVRVPAGVAVVAATAAGTVVGRHAATRLPAGTLLAPADVRQVYSPPAGEALVGVAVTAVQLPAGGVSAGQQVDVVVTSPAGSPGSLPATTGVSVTPGTGISGMSAAGTSATAVPGTVLVDGASVVSIVQPPPTGGTTTTSVSLLVPVAMAPQVAELSAAGQVALVVLPVGP